MNSEAVTFRVGDQVFATQQGERGVMPQTTVYRVTKVAQEGTTRVIELTSTNLQNGHALVLEISQADEKPVDPPTFILMLKSTNDAYRYSQNLIVGEVGDYKVLQCPSAYHAHYQLGRLGSGLQTASSLLFTTYQEAETEAFRLTEAYAPRPFVTTMYTEEGGNG